MAEEPRAFTPLRTLWIYLLYRWLAWELALIGVFASGGEGLRALAASPLPILMVATFVANLLLTFFFESYCRLARRTPWLLAADIIFCSLVYGLSGSWYSPFTFYAYSSLMLPAALHFYKGGLLAAALYFVLGQVSLVLQGYTPRHMLEWGSFRFYLTDQLVPFLIGLVLAHPHRLYEELRRTRQQFAETEREWLLLQERQRIAGDLHDNVAQHLFGIGLRAREALERLATVADWPSLQAALRADLLRIMELAGQGGDAVRQVIFAFSAQADLADLSAALARLADRFTQRTGVSAHFVGRGNASALPLAVRETLYRVAQEGLSNVEKHAHAATVVVSLTVNERQVTLSVQDDGVGLPPGSVLPDGEEGVWPHFGLANLQRALRGLGGTLYLTNNEDLGAILRVRLPLERTS